MKCVIYPREEMSAYGVVLKTFIPFVYRNRTKLPFSNNMTVVLDQTRTSTNGQKVVLDLLKHPRSERIEFEHRRCDISTP